jgi:regulator of replication initiation timing
MIANIICTHHVFRNLKEAKAELGSLKRDLESVKQQENKLQEENENLKSEKDTISKDLSATKYTLGNCKNKNMDHEVRSLELLQEIEGLKKELKAC